LAKETRRSLRSLARNKQSVRKQKTVNR